LIKLERHLRRRAGWLALLLAVAGPAGASEVPSADRVVVGSKNFTESRLLAEMFARLLEARTSLHVDRRLGLAGTQVCFEALRTGAIDVYPEYTGTGLVAILDESPQGDARTTLEAVRREFLARWDLWWLAPLGFENSFEIAVPRSLATRLGLRTISDLAHVAPTLRAGFGHEFVEREDGLVGLQRVYGLQFGSIRQMQQALQYEAAGAGHIDCMDAYTTDGRLLVHDLVVLEDDRGFFPPYEAAALVRGATLARHPEVGAVLGLLAGSLDADHMRRLNWRIEARGEAIERVAQDALEDLGLVGNRTVQVEGSGRVGLPLYMWTHRRSLAARTAEHVGLTAAGLALAILVALPLGVWLERHRRVAEPIVRAVGTTQTIPSLALLAFMVPILGIGALPAVVALWLYAIFPILRNTYTGLRDAGPSAVEAATALGMTRAQVLRHVRLPLAAPIILAGIRTAGVITVGTATLAAFIGAGGLGEPIVSGVQAVDPTLILSGALPAAGLALLVDYGLGKVEQALRPRGIARESEGRSR
jgi:osmoprotectant transport system substrate-binding protein/osmoprotectant transport system permease protein